MNCCVRSAVLFVLICSAWLPSTVNLINSTVIIENECEVARWHPWLLVWLPPFQKTWMTDSKSFVLIPCPFRVDTTSVPALQHSGRPFWYCGAAALRHYGIAALRGRCGIVIAIVALRHCRIQHRDSELFNYSYYLIPDHLLPTSCRRGAH